MTLLPGTLMVDKNWGDVFASHQVSIVLVLGATGEFITDRQRRWAVELCPILDPPLRVAQFDTSWLVEVPT